ncbi:WD40 repeat-like protein [Flagelloscypha sp. PMI_526]|nr:WD40 repeat-like protein [Flagelloscypha sp. PMI_526]
MSKEINIPLSSQAFDLAFHPTQQIVFTGLLTGEDSNIAIQGVMNHVYHSNLQRNRVVLISLNDDGSLLFATGQGKALHMIDLATSKISWSRFKAHKTSINKVKILTENILATGDDDGVINLWDTREEYSKPLKSLRPSFSGDGTLSVTDIRSKKGKYPFVQSEDQEDELLSLSELDGGSKLIVGTQSGVLSIWDRSKGWGDCVDRVTGHPSSVDSNLLSSALLSTDSTVQRTGIVTDHGDWPVEKIAIGTGTSQEPDEEQSPAADSADSVSDIKYWVGSRTEGGDEDESQDGNAEGEVVLGEGGSSDDGSEHEAESSPEPVGVAKPRKRKGKNKDPLQAKRSKREDVTAGDFFDEL